MPKTATPDRGAGAESSNVNVAGQTANSVATATAQPAYGGPVPDLVGALDLHGVSFEQVSEAYFGRHDAADNRKSEYERLYPQLQAAYANAHGATTTYFTEPRLKLRAGIAISNDGELALVYDAGLAPSNTLYLLGWLSRINIESRTLLTGAVLAQYSKLAYSAGTKVLSVMEQQKDRSVELKHEELADRIRVAESTLHDAEAFSVRTSQTIARSLYSSGMLAGLGLLAVVVLTLNWLLPALGWLGEDDSHFLFLTMLTGGVGAVVSVVARSGSLTLDYAVGRDQLKFFGLFRPLIGGVFGFILCALIRSKVVNFVAIPDQSQALFYYVTVAFLGGFSERLVPGILESAERRFSVAGSGRRSGQATDDAAPSAPSGGSHH